MATSQGAMGVQALKIKKSEDPSLAGGFGHFWVAPER